MTLENGCKVYVIVLGDDVAASYGLECSNKMVHARRRLTFLSINCFLFCIASCSARAPFRPFAF